MIQAFQILVERSHSKRVLFSSNCLLPRSVLTTCPERLLLSSVIFFSWSFRHSRCSSFVDCVFWFSIIENARTFSLYAFNTIRMRFTKWDVVQKYAYSRAHLIHIAAAARALFHLFTSSMFEHPFPALLEAGTYTFDSFCRRFCFLFRVRVSGNYDIDVYNIKCLS